MAAITLPAVAFAAAPLAPTGTAALPVYSAARPISVTWTDASADETEFAIERSVDGGAFAQIDTVAAIAGAGGMGAYTDSTVKDLNKTYAYRVVAKNADGSNASGSFSTAIGVTWPTGNGSHQLMQGFADGSPNSALKFHEGMDLFATGTFNTVVARAGKVVERVLPTLANPTQGYVVVEVDTGGGAKEYDLYIHIDDLNVALNDAVPEGKVLAKKIASFGDAGKSDHLHFSVMRNTVASATTDAAFEKLWLNPFARFTRAADRDPLEKKPGLADSNRDDKTIILTPSGKTVPPGNFQDVTTDPVKAGIDIIADVRDQMNDTFKQAAAPNKVGYYVKGLFDQGVTAHHVRTAADPYVLAKFDDNWFNDRPFNAGKFSAVYADDGAGAIPTDAAFDQQLRIKKTDNTTSFPFTKQYTVTNTKGNDGRVANVDAAQFWSTAARNTARSDTAPNANFAADLPAARNAEARFKDGDYELHITSSDLVNDVDSNAGRVRVDNFKQTAQAMLGGGIALGGGPLAPLYDTNNLTPFLTALDSEINPVNGIFNLNDQIGIQGSEYYPNLLLPAYVFPFHANWSQGEPLTGAIASIVVLSDGNGDVPLTNAWTASETGLFSVVIDYDRDGEFSSTLDGLNGFEVIPEPASLAVIGLIALLGTTRFRRVARVVASS